MNPLVLGRDELCFRAAYHDEASALRLLLMSARLHPENYEPYLELSSSFYEVCCIPYICS